ncbi:MAG: ribonuclease J [Alphaproteobacteria bacterium]|jgi:ribonuclease J|nr:ribonuclease J [Alphaproteobacteria bacterium]
MENKNKVSFFSLGGLGEIGLNSYVYTNEISGNKEYLMVDLGMGFKDTRTISVDTFFPDISFFTDNNITPAGIVITHGHEDHIGALPYLMPYLENTPIYATPWTLDLIKSKLKEFNLDTKVKLIAVESNKEYDVGSFKVKWVPIYHSIVDCSLLVITTSMGKIVHSGDFKTKPSDRVLTGNLEKLVDENAYYLVCESTNVLEAGVAGEESEVKDELKKLVASAKGATWIGMFSSNLERVRIIADIAKELKKRIVLYGRSLNTYADIGIKHGFLDSNFFITEEASKEIDRDKLIILATGSQGEDRSVLYNVIVRDEYREKLQRDDIVIFASKVIPGNESKVFRYYNILADRNITYYTTKDHHIHVSGHAKIDEIVAMYNYVRPKYILPMHGEAIHLRGQMELARSMGFESDFFHCGEVVELFNGTPHVIDNVEIGKLTYEGGRIVSYEEEFLKNRTKMFFEGAVFLSISLNKRKDITNFALDTVGLLMESEIQEAEEKIYAKINSTLAGLEDSSPELIQEEIRKIIRRIFKDSLDKKPIIKIHLAI